MTKETLIESIELYLKDNFLKKDFRLKHIMNVKKVAISLAKIHNVDLADVIVASLLHDATKYYTERENREMIKNYFPNLDISKFPVGCYHSLTAEMLAKEKFMISDVDILNAIRYHCSGRNNMSKLEKIIFVSDFIEESRTFVTKELRDLANYDLDKTVYKIMLQTVNYLERNSETISSLTQEAIKNYETLYGGI